MIIKAYIPVEKNSRIVTAVIAGELVDVTGSYFKHKEAKVEAIRITRTALDASRKRFYYHADIKEHPDVHPDYPRSGKNGAMKVPINRQLNPRWKAPKFPDEVDEIEVSE